MKAQLILKPSNKMAENRKENRHERTLIRLSNAARKALKCNEGEPIEVWPDSNGIDRVSRSVHLNVYKAFSDDIKAVKEDSTIQPQEKNLVGFVTPETYRRIMGTDQEKRAWVSQSIHDIVIGSDPEFLLFDENNEVVNAYTVLGSVRSGKLSSDGNMTEIRPDPGLTPEELVSNIRNIFNDNNLTHRIRSYTWKSACYHSYSHPVGGHLHIGTPMKVARTSWNNLIFKVLDKALSELLTIPMVKLDGDEGRARRGDGSYGHFGDFRLEHGRLEHRSLSGLWLTHPVLSTAVIGTAKAIVDEFYNRIEDKKFDLNYVIGRYNNDDLHGDFNYWHRVPIMRDIGTTKSNRIMREIINNSNRDMVTDELIRETYNTMSGFSVYNEYSTYIDTLYAILSRPGEELDNINRDLKQNWCEDAPFSINI